MRSASLLLALSLLAPPAVARDYCPDRPGLDTPPCTVEPGRLSAELSPLDWTHDRTDTEVDDTLTVGDLLLRYGIAEHAEVRLGWTPYIHQRSRDLANGAITSASGTGDVTLGLKRNLVDPDGQDFSIALLPSVTLPTGSRAVGAGEWQLGLQAPVSAPLREGLSLVLTPEVEWVGNADADGHHLGYGLASGLSLTPAKGVNLALEAEVMRDDDPAGPSTEAVAGGSAGVMLGKATQIDLGGAFALNAASPDRRLYLGIAHRF